MGQLRGVEHFPERRQVSLETTRTLLFLLVADESVCFRLGLFYGMGYLRGGLECDALSVTGASGHSGTVRIPDHAASFADHLVAVGSGTDRLAGLSRHISAACAGSGAGAAVAISALKLLIRSENDTENNHANGGEVTHLCCGQLPLESSLGDRYGIQRHSRLCKKLYVCLAQPPSLRMRSSVGYGSEDSKASGSKVPC